MKLLRFAVLAFFALSVSALTGCTSAYHQGHIYAGTYLTDRVLETDVQTRNDKKREWKDEMDRHSAKRLAIYFP